LNIQKKRPLAEQTLQQSIVYSTSEAMIPNSIREVTQIIESKSIGHEDCDNKAWWPAYLLQIP